MNKKNCSYQKNKFLLSGVIDTAESTLNLNVLANSKLCAKTLLKCETAAQGKKLD
jgi:hypothetical protein